MGSCRAIFHLLATFGQDSTAPSIIWGTKINNFEQITSHGVTDVTSPRFMYFAILKHLMFQISEQKILSVYLRYLQVRYSDGVKKKMWRDIIQVVIDSMNFAKTLTNEQFKTEEIICNERYASLEV